MESAKAAAEARQREVKALGPQPQQQGSEGCKGIVSIWGSRWFRCSHCAADKTAPGSYALHFPAAHLFAYFLYLTVQSNKCGDS